MRWCRLIPLVLFGSFAAHASEQPLSLEEAVEHALQTAPQLSAQTERVSAAEQLIVSAGRLPDPELIVGIDNLPVTGPDAYSTTSDFNSRTSSGSAAGSTGGKASVLMPEIDQRRDAVTHAETFFKLRDDIACRVGRSPDRRRPTASADRSP